MRVSPATNESVPLTALWESGESGPLAVQLAVEGAKPGQEQTSLQHLGVYHARIHLKWKHVGRTRVPEIAWSGTGLAGARAHARAAQV